MDKTVIVFAPHPDDETMGCGGTIAKKISEGFEVIIVSLTDGRHAFTKVLGISSNPNPEDVKRIRKEELIKAAAILGVPITNLFFLDFEDGTLEKNQMQLEEKIIEILRKSSPVEIYLPFIRDCNRDHQVASRVIRSGVQKLGLTSAKYQYSITHKYSRIGPRTESFLNLFKNNIVEVDVSEYLSLKQKAIEEFKSEVSIISSTQKQTVAGKIDRFLGNKEIFYVVR